MSGVSRWFHALASPSCARVPITRSRPHHALASPSRARVPITRSRPHHALASPSRARVPITRSRPHHALASPSRARVPITRSRPRGCPGVVRALIGHAQYTRCDHVHSCMSVRRQHKCPPGCPQGQRRGGGGAVTASTAPQRPSRASCRRCMRRGRRRVRAWGRLESAGEPGHGPVPL